MRTQVGIVGAGPAGLVLSHLLHREGIDSVILEARTREYVQERVRAGVLEQNTVDLLNETGVGERLRQQGLVHHGIELRFQGHGHRIDFQDLTNRAITIYAQAEVVKDLIDARLAVGGTVIFEAEEVAPKNLEGPQPSLQFRKDGQPSEVSCDLIAGCDGFHGICRPSIPSGVLTTYDRIYPFAWLGILAEAAPSSEELVYCYHERGFALLSMRSPKLSRLYLQCAPDEEIDKLVRRSDLAGTPHSPRPRRMESERRPNRSKRHCRHEKLCRGADAIRAPFSCWGRGAHCSADRG